MWPGKKRKNNPKNREHYVQLQHPRAMHALRLDQCSCIHLVCQHCIVVRLYTVTTGLDLNTTLLNTVNLGFHLGPVVFNLWLFQRSWFNIDSVTVVLASKTSWLDMDGITIVLAVQRFWFGRVTIVLTSQFLWLGRLLESNIFACKNGLGDLYKEFDY